MCVWPYAMVLTPPPPPPPPPPPRFVISSGDVYNFHFVKNEKMVCIHDSGGTKFSIPLNSAIGFGILYNPK